MSSEHTTADGDRDEQPVKPLDPEKLGTATVQENGCIYVGRDLAGEELHFAVERADD